MTGKYVLFIAAGVEAILFSAVVALVMSANFTPNVSEGADYAAITAIRVVTVVGAFAIIHGVLQTLLAVHRPDTPHGGERVFDAVTTVLPLATLFVTKVWMWNTVAAVGYWNTLNYCTTFLVVLSMAVDIYAGYTMLKKW